MNARYIILIRDRNLLIEIGSYAKYHDCLAKFRQTIALGSHGRWKEVYLEGRDKAGQFVDVYELHKFE